MFHEFEVILWSCLLSATPLAQLEAEVDDIEEDELTAKILQLVLKKAFESNYLVSGGDHSKLFD